MRLTRLVTSLVATTAVLSTGHVGAAPPAPEQRLAATKKLDARLRVELSSELFTSARIIPVFVKTRDVARSVSAITALGGRVGTIARDILTARLPAGAIRTLAAEASVVAIEGGRPVKKRLDAARAVTRVDDVHGGAEPLPAEYRGRGVIVGVIDYGLDLGHESFLDASGASRVLALWDHAIEGTPPSGYSYGHECSADDIAAGSCSQSEPRDAHGTHVTSIAAGSAVAGSPYAGVAPEADIVFVDVAHAPGVEDPNEAFTTGVCDAVAYIFGVAEREGKPAVVNMSLGEHTGPHDGTSLADQCLDNLSGPGRILVAAAGNEGVGSVHEGGDPVRVHAWGQATEETRYLQLLLGTEALNWVFVYTDSDASLSVQIGLVDANDNPVLSEPLTLGGEIAPTPLASGDLVLGPIIGSSEEVTPGGTRGYGFAIVDDNEDGQEAQQLWLLAVSGEGRFDAFIDTTDGAGFTTEQMAGIESDHRMTIGYPAIASQVLAVASMVSKNSWTSADGSEHDKQSAGGVTIVVGERSDFSSRGPARNDSVVGVKPDITAPGEMIVAALHSGREMEADKVIVGAPDGYTIMEGTSMASPHVAGVVALMLEAEPQLGVADIRAIFDAYASLPEDVNEVDPNDWGRGIVDAFSALVAVTESMPVADGDPVEPGPEEVEVEPAPEQEADTGPQPEPAAETVAEPAPPEEDDGGCAGGGGSPLAPVGFGVLALALARRRAVGSAR